MSVDILGYAHTVERFINKGGRQTYPLPFVTAREAVSRREANLRAPFCHSKGGRFKEGGKPTRSLLSQQGRPFQGGRQTYPLPFVTAREAVSRREANLPAPFCHSVGGRFKEGGKPTRSLLSQQGRPFQGGRQTYALPFVTAREAVSRREANLPAPFCHSKGGRFNCLYERLSHTAHNTYIYVICIL